MILSLDIRSMYKPETIYGKQNDSVVVIAYHGSVAIVENILGERFPVQAALLSGKPVEIIEIAPIEIEPVVTTSIKKEPAPKKIITPVNQTTLFI